MNSCCNFEPHALANLFMKVSTIELSSTTNHHVDNEENEESKRKEKNLLKILVEPVTLEFILNIFKWLIIAIVLSFLMIYPLFADDGSLWLKKIETAEKVPHSYGIMKQTITTSSGKERSFTIRSWSREDGDESLMLYTNPARVRGDKILQREGGDNIWYYMKRRDVERHFAGHQRKKSAMGSDFSYEDLASGDITEDYTAEFVAYEDVEGESCVKLKCTPTESGPSYEHIILWASQNDHYSRKIEYYDDKGHLKTLYISDFRDVEGRLTAFVMDMVNHREGSHTLMVTESISYKDEPEEWIFQKDALSREIK